MKNQHHTIAFSDLRKEYSTHGLHRDELHQDPFTQFHRWFEEASASGVIEPNAFFLATATSDGKPSCRAVLMKHFDENGLVFFTNYTSRKSFELEANPYAAATFWWGNMEREVRIEGHVEKTTQELSAEYFSRRPRTSQLGAWAAARSGTPLANKKSLEESYKKLEKQFEGLDIPLPHFWGGYRIIPDTIEFWQGSQARLHDRFLYVKGNSGWEITRLTP